AELYAAQQQFVAAEHYYRRSLAIREAHLGADHAAVASALEKISRLYILMGRMEDAKGLSERAARIRKR
ncbi:MAG: tetratricopeptide repeat protein, partial [Burkholderiales bacterium]